MEERFETFTVLVAKINKCIKKIKSQVMEEFNLKSSHVSCLYYIYEHKSLTAAELVDICNEDKAAISRALVFLEENGFLTSETSGKKRYRTQIMVTEKGKIVSEKISKSVEKYLCKASEGFTEEERLTMYKCLALIAKNLDDSCDD